MAREHRISGKRESSNLPIGPRELARVRADGPEALRWQRSFGLAKAKQACIGLMISGSVPFIGLVVLGWNVAAMLVFIAIDVLATLLADAIKLLLAGPVVRHTHARDHSTQQVMSIVGGLEDGTNTWIDHGRGVSPPGLFLISLVCAVLFVPVMIASLEALGAGSLRDALDATWFREVALGSVALHLLQSTFAAIGARGRAVEEQALYLDSGGIIGLLVGMMFLIWLLAIWAANGVVAMLAIVFLFKLGFGVFALYWIPRVTRALQRFLEAPATG